MVALMRRALGGDDEAMIGWSKPPYKQWQWAKTKSLCRRAQFHRAAGDEMVAGGACSRTATAQTQTAIGPMTLNSYDPKLVLPSGGDSSYPALHGTAGCCGPCTTPRMRERPPSTSPRCA